MKNFTKKLLLLAIILFSISFSEAQTVLNSFDLELKKPAYLQKSIAAANNKKEVFVFAADKQNLTGLKYNASLFFSDSIRMPTPEKDFEILSGFSFDKEQNPTVYFASEDFRKVRAITFNFQDKQHTTKDFTFSLADEVLLSTFSESDTFYYLTHVRDNNQLKLYVFKDGVAVQKILDFSKIAFSDSKKNKFDLEAVLELGRLEKMETKMFNPLPFATAKAKFYVLPNEILLTFNYDDTATQAITIDLNKFTIDDQKWPKTVLENADSNSFYSAGKLYQLVASKEKLDLEVFNYISGESITRFQFSKDAVSVSKNSGFFIQTANQRPRELKNAKKFLGKLQYSNIGLTVYDTNNGALLTIGGQSQVASTGGLILGVASIGAAVSGNGIYVGDLDEFSVPQTLYFETQFDNNSQYLKNEQSLLATDYISNFMQQNRDVMLPMTFRYNNYFILSYYDKEQKKIVLRKFEDSRSE